MAGDKGYDTRQCVATLRARSVTPHVAQNSSGRRSAIDRRTTRHAGYAISQRKRKRVEEIFGWMKTIGGFRRTRFIGLALMPPGGARLSASAKLRGGIVLPSERPKKRAAKKPAEDEPLEEYLTL